MATRLVTFLGLGPKDNPPPYYTPCRYSFGGKVSQETPLIERALCEILEDVQSLVVLGTKDVYKRWIDSGLFVKHVGREPYFVQLPEGKTDEERWQLFELVAKMLSCEPIEQAGESSAPDRIVLDVTHGFRSQPIFGMGAVNFVLSEWNRLNIESPPTLKILYGAYESKDDDENIAPIWDLTQFVGVARWNAALDALMRYGRADDFEMLARSEAREWVASARKAGLEGGQLAKEHFIARLGKTAKEFSDSIVVNRLKNVLTAAAPKLRKTLEDESIELLNKRMPVLKNSLEQLKGMVEKISSSSTFGWDGLRASGRLAELLGRLHRFAEQATVLREIMVTLFGLVSGDEPVAEPGSGQFSQDQRRVLEERWNVTVQKFRDGELKEEFFIKLAKLSTQIQQIRNDIDHCGLRDAPMSASGIRKKLEKLTAEINKLIEEVMPADESTVQASSADES